MKCIFCGARATKGKIDCSTCFNMGGNVPYDDFLNLSHRIANKTMSITRPNTHPLCPNSTCKARKKHFPTFASQQRLKGGNINKELFNEITEYPCFYCLERRVRKCM